jgi:hypothetical protein
LLVELCFGAIFAPAAIFPLIFDERLAHGVLPVPRLYVD